MRVFALLAAAFVAVPALFGGVARAQTDDYVPSASDFGGVGLMQTRSARFGPDGQLDVGYSEIVPYERYLITLQALPANATRLGVRAEFEKVAQGGRILSVSQEETAEIERRLIGEIHKALEAQSKT